MTHLDKFAQALIKAHQTGQRIAPPNPDLSRDDILSVQSQVSAALGAVAGFKVGATDGLPILAPIPTCYVTANGGSRRVRDRLGVELEVGFELTRPLPGAGLPETPQAYFRPRVIIELVDTRITGEAADDPRLKFADLQLNSGMVIGEGPADWDGADFGTVSARLTANSTNVLDGAAKVPGGSALSNLDLLLTHLGDHCGGLQVGQIVITGALSGVHWFDPGTEISGWIKDLGDVSVSLP